MGFTRMSKITTGKDPKHVAIIMDGNGRWAKKRNQPRLYGHKKGAERVREIIKASGELGIKVLTLFAFSDENWKRPTEEVSGLFNLLSLYLKKEIDSLVKNNIKLNVIGDLVKIPNNCRILLEDATEKTRSNTGLNLVLALSYGGRSDILQSVVSLAKKVKDGQISPEEIEESHIGMGLLTKGIPEPDLLVRTSGEQRISNFLLWQMAYTELYFCNAMWPDFSKSHFEEALLWFRTRERRFGRVLSISDKESHTQKAGGALC